MKTIKYILYTFGFFIFFITAVPAYAFGISPVKSLLTVNQGTSQTIVVKIKNSEKNSLTFKLSVLGMSQDDNGRPIFARGIDAAEGWVYPENNLVNIKSGETKSVNFIIKIPIDALAGSHYLGLAVEPVLEKSDQQSLATRLVSLLTLEVKGLVQESVAIEKWEPAEESPSLVVAHSDMNSLAKDNSKIWKFNLSFKNSGTIEVSLRGIMAVRNWRGEEIFSEPVTLGNKLLAGSRRVLQPEITLRNEINLPGLYSAQVKINYGLTNQVVSAISYVWYFPRWSKIVLVITVLLIAFLIFWRVRRVKR